MGSALKGVSIVPNDAMSLFLIVGAASIFFVSAMAFGSKAHNRRPMQVEQDEQDKDDFSAAYEKSWFDAHVFCQTCGAEMGWMLTGKKEYDSTTGQPYELAVYGCYQEDHTFYGLVEWCRRQVWDD